MRQFKDSEGVLWNVSINVGTIRRVRDVLSLDLADPTAVDPNGPTHEGKPIALVARLDTDLYLLPDVLFVLCNRQADELKVSDVEFGIRLGGEAMRAAHDAFFEEWQGFFRSLGREDLATVIAKEMRFVKAALAKTAALMASPAVDKHLDDAVERLGTRFTNALESLGSTPTSGPSAT